MLADLDELVHLRRAQPQRPELWCRPGAGSDHPKVDRRLSGDGRLRLCRPVPIAPRRREHLATFTLHQISIRRGDRSPLGCISCAWMSSPEGGWPMKRTLVAIALATATA